MRSVYALCFIGLLAFANAATLLVSTSGNDANNCVSSACASMTRALEVATNGDTISIGAGTFTGPNNRNLTIDGRTLTIQGAGAANTIFMCGNLARFASVTGGSVVTFRDFTIRNGSADAPPTAQYAPNAGGALALEYSTVTIDGVDFVENLAPGFIFFAPGGALFLLNTNTTILNSNFYRNKGGIAGAIYFGGVSRTVIRNVKMVGNYNIGGWGGAMVPEDNSYTELYDTLFEANYGDYGGAVDDGTNAVWSCTNCTFYRNRGAYGGAYYAYADARSTFKNCKFIENSVPNAGGASQTSTRTVVLFEDCLFKGNSASDTAAVGCANYGTTFRRCVFEDNTTPTVASAINIRLNVTVDGCTFINNYAGERGAIATTGYSSSVIKNSVFIDNKSAITAAAILFESAVPYDLKLSNLTFINNDARALGGAMFASGEGTIEIDGIYARGGFAGNGGLMAISTTAGTALTVNIKNADIENMLATQGGAFHVSGGARLNVNTSTVSYNEAIATGGAFYIDGSSKLTLRGVTAEGNLARYGGLVSFSLLSSAGCDASVLGSTLRNNSATNGGGIFWSENDIPACTFDLTGTTNNGANGGSYGDLRASPPHSVRLEVIPPSRIAPSKVFTAVLSVLDFYNQTVKNNKNFVGEVTIVSATGNATFGGVSREDITANGTVSFSLLRINARPGTNLLVDFHTLPRLSRSEYVNITITPCEAGFEEYTTADGVYYCLRTVDTTSATQIALAIICGVLGFVCIVLFFVLFKNQDSPIIRAASPLFCLSIVLGGLLTIAAAFMFLWNTDATCALRPWFYALGFMIIYGSLFVKEFRMFRIFNANLTKPLRITNQQLFGMIGAGLVVEIAILIGWFASGPYVRIPRVDDLLRATEPAITYECSSRNPAAFWVLVGFNLLLLTVCSVIAFLTRNLPDTLNESKGLAFSIYNCTLTMVVCLVIGGVLYSPTAVSLVGSIGILFSTAVTLGAIFLPKLWLALRKDAVIQSIREDISQLKSDIEWKERQIVEIERGFRGESSASKDTSMTAGSTRMNSASAAPSGVVSGNADSDSDSDSSSSEKKPAKRVAKKAGAKRAAKKAAAKKGADSDSESESEEEKPQPKKVDKKPEPKPESDSESESEEKPKKKADKKPEPKKAESESESESEEKKPAKKASQKKPAKKEESSSSSASDEESS